MKQFVIVCGLLVLGACVNENSQKVEASVDSGFEVVGEDNANLATGVCSTEIVDTETGVHYLIVSTTRADGGISVIPLYNADGTLKQD